MLIWCSGALRFASRFILREQRTPTGPTPVRGGHDQPATLHSDGVPPHRGGRPTMINVQPMPPGAVLVAISIAKLHHDVLIAVPNARRHDYPQA